MTLVAALWPPARMSALPGGFAMLYECLDARERQLGINCGAAARSSPCP